MKEFIEKLNSRLKERSAWHQKYGDSSGYTFAGYEGAISIVNELAEEHKGGWIPVSERLPEDDTKQYIVQKTNGFIDILGFTKDAYKLSRYDFYEYNGKKKQFFYGYDSEYGYIEYECVAWMPLPEKYKGE